MADSMKHDETGGTITALFEDGEDVLECYERLAGIYGIRHAVVLSGIGMLKDARIGYYKADQKTGEWSYDWKVFCEPAELVSTSGGIMVGDDGKHAIHVHVAIAGADHRLHGGHLGGGTVCVKNEVYINKLQ